MGILGHIRITSAAIASHHEGAVLSVSDNPALHNPDVIYRDRAVELIENGTAVWIGGDDEPVETTEMRERRHGLEREELDGRQAAESRDLTSRHIRDHEAPDVRDRRHMAARARLMEQHRAQHHGVLDGAVRGQLYTRHAQELDDLKADQAAEPGVLMARQQQEHEAMIVRHGNEHAALLDRQEYERKEAAFREAEEAWKASARLRPPVVTAPAAN